MTSATGPQRSIARCTHTKYVFIAHANNASRLIHVQQPNGLFKNYADDNSDRNFDDASSSALLAATVYRLDLLTGNKTFIAEAERTRAALFAANGTAAIPSRLWLNLVPDTASSSSPTSFSDSDSDSSSSSSSTHDTLIGLVGDPDILFDRVPARAHVLSIK
jgi:hypothetical protein